jgi:hypothetical protein
MEGRMAGLEKMVSKGKRVVDEANGARKGLQPGSCGVAAVGEICPSKCGDIQGVEIIVASWVKRSIE